jgi:hypothetical protein
MVAPGALAAAAGVGALASRLPLNERWDRRWRWAIAVCALALVASQGLQGTPVRTYRPALETRLGLADQIDAVRILGGHGFGAGDLERRVHGPSWTRWEGGQVYIGRWLIGVESHAHTDEHVVIVQCEHLPPAFPLWRRGLVGTPAEPPLSLVGYHAQLAPVRIEFIGSDGVLWGSDHAVPFYGQMVHRGDAQMRLLFDPRLGYPPEFADLQTRWLNHQPTKMRLTTTLAPGSEDRAITLTYDAGLVATVTVNGAPAKRLGPVLALGPIALERFLVSSADRAADVQIEATIDLPPQAIVPQRADMYEEPQCGLAP